MSHPTPPPPPHPGKPVAPPAPGAHPDPAEMVDEDVLRAAVDGVDEISDEDAAAAVRMLIMQAATDLDAPDVVPDDWNTDGTVGDPAAHDD